jgi:predicted lysophospholipase L1 biosynthesis ABC-type transport system permease subunit
MAIGARMGHIAGLFLRQALALAVIGITIGVPLALVAGGYFESVLYAVEPDSASTLTATVAVLAIVTVLASVLPALRAPRVNPTIALRELGRSTSKLFPFPLPFSLCPFSLASALCPLPSALCPDRVQR